jgi:hypothetical protein
VASGVDQIPPDVLKLHQHLTLTVDIMFVNNLPFLITKSRGLQFTTVEFLPNRQTATVNSMLQKVLHFYAARGLIVDAIYADHEFEVLRPWHPILNTTAADEHVPDIERHIRTVKESTRSTYRMLPFRRLPRIVLIHLVKNAVFWLNALPTNDGVTRQYSPRYLLTGQHVHASKHAVLPFGAYVQTHEAHDNDMEQRTLSCICLGPTGNIQGGHWFMSLTSGERIVRHRWTELPMPRDAITRINHIGQRQRMPSTITYSNRHGQEFTDTVDQTNDDVSITSDSDDDTYSQPSASDSDSVFSADSSDSDDDDSSSVSSDTSTDSDVSDDDAASAATDAFDNPPPPPPFHPPDPPANQGVDNPGVGDYDNPGVGDYDLHDPVDNQNRDEDEQGDDSEDESNNGDNNDDNASINDANEENEAIENEISAPTETEMFRIATEQGRANAAVPDATRPRRNVRPSRYDDFNYAFFDYMRNCAGATMSDKQFVHAFVTAQMSAKKGLQVFREEGASALMKELTQVVTMEVMSGCHAHELTREQKRRALRYLMFLKEKRCGRIKGRGCIDGRKQRLWKNKEDTTSPTVSIEALLLSCMIDAREERDVATIDIPVAFMQAFIDELVHVKFDGELIDLICQVDPSLSKFVTMENGKRVLYTKLNKALYGTVQASRLFWERLSTFLVEDNGFERNPYDFCVVNKIVDGKQMTIVWYVDDLKISHVDPSVVGNMIDVLKAEFGQKLDLTVRRGKIHEYLGLRLDFSNRGKVVMTMFDYISELVKETPDDLFKGPARSPASNYLFHVNPKAKKLDDDAAVLFHHLTAKLLYLSKRTRPDLLTAVSFLCTRVQSPDVDDWKKLGRCLTYLRDNADLPYTLAMDGPCFIRWWVDASYGVHPDMKSHTGATMSMGRGCVYAMSRRQKLNTRSSTEAELVGVNDAMSMILWTRRFLEGQGYTVTDNVLYQDNQSAMLLEKNGKMSSSKRTRHLDIRFFFVTDNVNQKNLRIEYCPTDSMLGDFFTKPLQGTKFITQRDEILGITPLSPIPPSSVRKECVEQSESSITSSGDNVTNYADESNENASWTEVVSKKKKKTDVSSRRSRNTFFSVVG